MTADDVTAMRCQPSWRARRASVPTIPRELCTAAALPFDATPCRDFALPSVLLLGRPQYPSEKPSLPRSTPHSPTAPSCRYPGQAHAAQIAAPHLIATRCSAPTRPRSGSPIGDDTTLTVMATGQGRAEEAPIRATTNQLVDPRPGTRRCSGTRLDARITHRQPRSNDRDARPVHLPKPADTPPGVRATSGSGAPKILRGPLPSQPQLRRSLCPTADA